MNRQRVVLRLIPIGVILAVVIAFFAFGLSRYLTVETLRANQAGLRTFASTHAFLAPLAFVGLYAGVVALSLPGAAIMTITGGFVFRLWIGALLSVVAATFGAVILFLLARFVVSDAVRRRAGPFMTRMAEGFERNAFSYLLFLRLVPIFPFWAINLAAALLGVPLRPFVLATLIGIIPGSLAYASIGDGLGLAVDAKTGHVTPMAVGLRVGFALLALLPIAIQWLKRRRSGQ
jgi:uncharacterized membrane protein YdjX (TVP38/TMEM64 family)